VRVQSRVRVRSCVRVRDSVRVRETYFVRNLSCRYVRHACVRVRVPRVPRIHVHVREPLFFHSPSRVPYVRNARVDLSASSQSSGGRCAQPHRIRQSRCALGAHEAPGSHGVSGYNWSHGPYVSDAYRTDDTSCDSLLQSLIHGLSQPQQQE